MKAFKLMFISAMVALLVLIGSQAKADYIDLFVADVNTGDFIHMSSNTGVVGFVGQVVGPSFTLNNVSGVTYPGLGTAAAPDLDLLSINVASTGPATLFIALSATGYTVPTGASGFDLEIGGTVHGNVTSIEAQAWYGAGNNFLTVPSEWLEIGTTGLLATNGPFDPQAAFSGSVSGPFDITASPFALGIITILNVSGAANVSYDAELTTGKVPEPMSLILLGGGLAGAGLYRRLRRK